MMVGSSMDDESESIGGVGVGVGVGVPCSICLELVVGNGDRSIAKLLCGHDFHLDCIGSAFNVKGEMQCPNCRQIEKGRWLYSSGSSRIFPEFNADEWRSEWNPDEEPYDIAFPELPFSVHWCPYGGVPRIRSSVEEVESSSATYHDLQGHHTIFAEHTGGSSVAPSYVTYTGQPPPPSNSNDGVDSDRFAESQLLSALPRSHIHDITPVHVFSSIDTLRFGESQPSFSLVARNFMNGADQPSNQPPTTAHTRGDSDSTTRTRTFAHQLLPAHRSGPRAGSSFAPSTIPHHPGRIIRSQERIQAPRVIHHHPQQPNTASQGMPSFALPDGWRYNGRLPPGAPPSVASSHSDHNGGFFVFPPPPNLSGRNVNESDNHGPVHTHIWERDYISHFPTSSFDRDSSGWGSNHQSTHGSDTGNVWPRHWS